MKFQRRISPPVRIPLEDYRSIEKVRNNFKIEFDIDIGWISSYKKWRKMGSPKY